MRATSFIFDTRTGVLVKVSTFLRQKMSRREGDSNPQPSDSCRILWPIELSEPDICCPMFLNTGSGGIFIFEVKLTFELLTVRGQSWCGGSCVLVKGYYCMQSDHNYTPEKAKILRLYMRNYWADYHHWRNTRRPFGHIYAVVWCFYPKNTARESKWRKSFVENI